MTTAAQTADLTPIEVPGARGGPYYTYTCSSCGKQTQNRYREPTGSRMLENRHCFDCDYWAKFERELKRDHHRMTIINGHVYGPGSRTSGSFRGMAGRRFDIEFIEPSAFAGSRITTFDLWSGSTLPETLRARFADTAKFLNGAGRHEVGEVNCWEPSSPEDKPYPLPSSLNLV